MSTTLELPEVSTDSRVGQRLRSETTAVRLHVRWPGVRKSLTNPQKRLAADAFDADLKSLSAAKKLIDTSHPDFKAVSAIRSQAVSYWRGITLPYVEPGVRLIRRDDVTACDAQLAEMQRALSVAVEQLDRSYEELVDQARDRLGNLFDASDYPASLSDQFEISWDYPSCSPPEYLRSVCPELYEQECRRVQARFDEAVQLAESAFAEELSNLVTHLAQRLSGEEDGRPKVFRDSAVTNLCEFFVRFQRLNIRSNAELDSLVERAQSVVQGVAPQELRDRPGLRERVTTALGGIESSLESWMADRPRRNIQRRAR